jgi:hypothetical protein
MPKRGAKPSKWRFNIGRQEFKHTFLFFFLKMSRRKTTKEDRLRREQLQIPSAKLNPSTGKIKQPGYKSGGDVSRFEQGQALARIISTGQKDIKFKPGFDTLESAQTWAETKRYHNHRKYGDDLIYEVRSEDIDHDGQPEIIIQKAHGLKPIYMINGYKLVQTKHQYRRAYDALFPNPTARRVAKVEHGITRKNFTQRALTFDTETGGYKGFKPFISPNRLANVSSHIKGKMADKKLTLGDAFDFFFFELAWKAFTRGVVEGKLIDKDTWRLAIPKLLQLYVQAKRQTLRDAVVQYAAFTPAEKEYFDEYPDISEFLHGRGQLIDLVWNSFVEKLFDGKDKDEKDLFGSFVKNIILAYPEVREGSKRAIEKISFTIQGARYSSDEEEIARDKLDRIVLALAEVDDLITEANTAALVEAGLAVNFGTDEKPLTLPDALTARMKLNQLNVNGGKGGDVTGKPVQTGDVPRDDAQKQMEGEVAQQTGETDADGADREEARRQSHGGFTGLGAVPE